MSIAEHFSIYVRIELFFAVAQKCSFIDSDIVSKFFVLSITNPYIAVVFSLLLIILFYPPSDGALVTLSGQTADIL